MNNTIEVLQDMLNSTISRIMFCDSSHSDEMKRHKNQRDALTKAIATLKAVESAEGLPEKKVIGMFDHNGSNRVFNDTISLCQIPYAKQILKIEELERSLEFYRMRCNVIEKEHRSFKEPERTIICNILANGQAKP